MTCRVLPHEEWPRLDGTYLQPLWRLLTPETSSILVVEDDGTIVGTWALMSVRHVEGFSAKNGVVLRMLLRKMKEIAAEAGITHVVTAAETDQIEDFLRRVDPSIAPIPGRHFVWTLPTV